MLRLYSHWVSGSPLARNTSRLPHLGWLVCREKRGRGNHYSSLLLLASDEALNPICMQVLRGHWGNNTEKQQSDEKNGSNRLFNCIFYSVTSWDKQRKCFSTKALHESQQTNSIPFSPLSIYCFWIEKAWEKKANLVTLSWQKWCQNTCPTVTKDYWGRWDDSMTPWSQKYFAPTDIKPAVWTGSTLLLICTPPLICLLLYKPH